MTTNQATKLFHYTRRLGYEADVHYAERRSAPRNSTTCVVRIKRPTDRLWSWCWGHRDWAPTIRYFRELDRADGLNT